MEAKVDHCWDPMTKVLPTPNSVWKDSPYPKIGNKMLSSRECVFDKAKVNPREILSDTLPSPKCGSYKAKVGPWETMRKLLPNPMGGRLCAIEIDCPFIVDMGLVSDTSCQVGVERFLEVPKSWPT